MQEDEIPEDEIQKALDGLHPDAVATRVILEAFHAHRDGSGMVSAPFDKIMPAFIEAISSLQAQIIELRESRDS